MTNASSRSALAAKARSSSSDGRRGGRLAAPEVDDTRARVERRRQLARGRSPRPPSRDPRREGRHGAGGRAARGPARRRDRSTRRARRGARRGTEPAARRGRPRSTPGRGPRRASGPRRRRHPRRARAPGDRRGPSSAAASQVAMARGLSRPRGGRGTPMSTSESGPASAGRPRRFRPVGRSRRPPPGTRATRPGRRATHRSTARTAASACAASAFASTATRSGPARTAAARTATESSETPARPKSVPCGATHDGWLGARRARQRAQRARGRSRRRARAGRCAPARPARARSRRPRRRAPCRRRAAGHAPGETRPERAGPWTRTPMPSVPTKGSNRASRALSAACAAAAIATAAPDARVAGRLGAGPARRGQEQPRLSLTTLDERARLDDRRMPGEGGPVDLGADGVPAATAPSGASRGAAIPTVSAMLGGSSVGPARRPARDHQAARSAASRGSAARSDQLATEVRGGRAVRDLDGELLARERRRDRDASRRVGREVARREVDRRRRGIRRRRAQSR